MPSGLVECRPGAGRPRPARSRTQYGLLNSRTISSSRLAPIANRTALVVIRRNLPGEHRCQLRSIREIFETIAIDVHGAGVHAGEETGAARRAERALAIGVSEGRTRGDQAIDIGCRYVFAPQGGNRVVALLIGANPENIWRHLEILVQWEGVFSTRPMDKPSLPRHSGL